MKIIHIHIILQDEFIKTVIKAFSILLVILTRSGNYKCLFPKSILFISFLFSDWLSLFSVSWFPVYLKIILSLVYALRCMISHCFCSFYLNSKFLLHFVSFQCSQLIVSVMCQLPLSGSKHRTIRMRISHSFLNL